MSIIVTVRDERRKIIVRRTTRGLFFKRQVRLFLRSIKKPVSHTYTYRGPIDRTRTLLSTRGKKNCKVRVHSETDHGRIY